MENKKRFYTGMVVMYIGGFVIGMGFSRNPLIIIGIGLVIGTIGNLLTGGFKYKLKQVDE